MYYQQQQTQPQYRMPQYGLKGRPVASIEEVRAAAIDFDGSVFYFPDLANNRIYTKQINLDGTASLNMFELKKIPVEPVISNESYITREEFNSTILTLKELITESKKNDYEIK